MVLHINKSDKQILKNAVKLDIEACFSNHEKLYSYFVFIFLKLYGRLALICQRSFTAAHRSTVFTKTNSLKIIENMCNITLKMLVNIPVLFKHKTVNSITFKKTGYDQYIVQK